jgi:hypothetical protein
MQRGEDETGGEQIKYKNGQKETVGKSYAEVDSQVLK